MASSPCSCQNSISNERSGNPRSTSRVFQVDLSGTLVSRFKILPQCLLPLLKNIPRAVERTGGRLKGLCQGCRPSCQASISEAIGADAHAYILHVSGNEVVARNPCQRLEASFSRRGICSTQTRRHRKTPLGQCDCSLDYGPPRCVFVPAAEKIIETFQGIRFALLPTATRKMALLPCACGEKKRMTSSS